MSKKLEFIVTENTDFSMGRLNLIINEPDIHHTYKSVK
jgi:hypothetical protein